MIGVLTSFLLTVHLQISGGDSNSMQGKWKITAVIEDRRSLTTREIAMVFAEDSTMTIDGNMIRFVPIGGREARKIVFVTNSTAKPATIDLSGTQKVGSKGIYLLSGDHLLVCLKIHDNRDLPKIPGDSFAPPPQANPARNRGADERPSGFSSEKGSDQLSLRSNASTRLPRRGRRIRRHRRL